jgi:excisionase family DNA binding protein
MPQTVKKKPRPASKNSPTKNSGPPDVMNLAEAAKFLKLPVKTIERLATEQDLPGRKIGKEWRFLRAAIERWLEGSRKTSASIMEQFGSLKDDPTYEEYRKILEENRRRWNEEVA